MVLAGLTGVGKTFLCLEMIRALVAAERPFGCPGLEVVKPLRVLYVEKELGWGLNERLRKIFRDDAKALDRLLCWSKPVNFYLSSPECLKWLSSYCDDNGIDVVVLDPLNKMHFHNENDPVAHLRIVDAFEQIQGGEKRAIIFAHHFKKPPRGREAKEYDTLDLYNIRGVGMDDVDFSLTVARRPGRLVAAWESWILDARFGKARHGGRPDSDDFMLYVNEHNDFRVHYRGNAESRSGKVLKMPEKGFAL